MVVIYVACVFGSLWANAALVVSPIWTLAQLAFDYSLLMTTVTANSMLSSSSAVFTFMVSVYLGLDRFTWMKVGAVTAYVCGTVLVTLADREPVSYTHLTLPTILLV